MNHFAKTFTLSACALAASVLISACGGGTSTDTVPPTVVITDDVAGATATGPVTFTFTFSEDVGSSFVIEDVAVTGGTAGTFTKVSGTVATLVVTPTANATGNVSVSVAAAKFKDLALNDNTVAASGSQAFNTTVVVASGSTGTCIAVPCLGFEAAAVGFVAFEGLGSATIVNDPVDATNKVAKLVKVATGQPWAGATVYTTTAAAQTVDAVGFATSKIITLRSYAPAVGEKIVLKVETGPNAGGMEKEVLTTKANEWETLTFDFSAPTAGAYDPAKVYKTISIFPKFLTAVTSDTSYYFDELKYAKVASPGIGFEASGVGFVAFEGLASATIVNDPVDATNKVAKLVKVSAGQPWAGATVYTTTAAAQTVDTVDFAKNKVITLRSYAPAIGEKIMLKVEIGPNGGGMEKEVLTTKANEWETLTFDFSAPTTGAYDPAKVYKTISIFPKFLTAVAADTTYYFDDLNYTAAAADAGGGAGTPAAEMGAGGTQALTVATADVKTGDGGNTMFVAGEGLFAVNYVGSAETTAPFNLAAWPGAKTTNFTGVTGVAGGSIGYFQDDANLSSSTQKVDELGWVAGTALSPNGVPSFFRVFVLKGAVASTAYMGLYVNAPNNGTVDTSSFSKIKFKVWGPAPMFERANFNPVLEMTLTGPKVAGCTTGSGGTEITQTFTANRKDGAGGFYTLPFNGFTVKGLCGTDTNANAVANVRANLARVVVVVPGTSFNYTNLDGGNYATGVNLGPVGFTNN